MTLSLSNLAQNELEIYKRTQADLNSNVAENGTFDDSKLLFDNYRAIHRAYLQLYKEANDEQTRLEALKRMVFLNWNWVVETDWLTGIDDLDETAVFEAYDILDKYLEEGRFDDELLWMLSHYAVWDYVILDVAEGVLLELTAFVETLEASRKSFPQELPQGTFDNRGQMGIYWTMMIKPAC